MTPVDAGRTGDPGHSLLVCIYYRVAAADAERTILAVREFQRTLAGHVGLSGSEVLLRFGLPNAATAPDPVPASSSVPVPDVPDADATLMETYRLALPAPAGSPRADAAVAAFLAALEARAAAVLSLVRGTRHVELFAPCAS